MSLTVGKIMHSTALPSFKGSSSVGNENFQEIKDGESKLNTALLGLAVLGAGALASVYAFKSGKAAGLKEALGKGSEASKPIERAVEETGEKIGEKIGIASRRIVSVKPSPDGEGTVIREAIGFKGPKPGMRLETVYDNDGTVLSKRIYHPGSSPDYIVKERIQRDGQNVTKKTYYANGKVDHISYYSFDPKNEVVKIVTQNKDGETFLVQQRAKERFSYMLTEQKIKNMESDYTLDYFDDGGCKSEYDKERIKEIIAKLNLPFEI